MYVPDTATSYDNIRPVLNPALRNLDDRDLASYLAANGISAEGLNDFLGAVSTAMPTIQRVAGGAMSGAQAGMAFGPYGALIGGIGGGLLSGLSGPGTPAAAPPPAAMPPAIASPVAPPPAPAVQPPRPSSPPAAAAPTPVLVGASAPGASPGAAQLLSLLSQPQVLQAVLSMAMGTLGSPSVNVGGAPLPVSAVPRALATIANNAASEFVADSYDESWMALGVDRNDQDALAEAVLDRFSQEPATGDEDYEAVY